MWNRITVAFVYLFTQCLEKFEFQFSFMVILCQRYVDSFKLGFLNIFLNLMFRVRFQKHNIYKETKFLSQTQIFIFLYLCNPMS